MALTPTLPTAAPKAKHKPYGALKAASEGLAVLKTGMDVAGIAPGIGAIDQGVETVLTSGNRLIHGHPGEAAAALGTGAVKTATAFYGGNLAAAGANAVMRTGLEKAHVSEGFIPAQSAEEKVAGMVGHALTQGKPNPPERNIKKGHNVRLSSGPSPT